MQKTYYYSGRVKSHDNRVAALETICYHGKECVDTDGFIYRAIPEEEAKKFWQIFDFEVEVGKVMSYGDAVELSDFLCK